MGGDFPQAIAGCRRSQKIHFNPRQAENLLHAFGPILHADADGQSGIAHPTCFRSAALGRPTSRYPQADFLKQAGVAAVFGPGTNIPEAAREVLNLVREKSKKNP